MAAPTINQTGQQIVASQNGQILFNAGGPQAAVLSYTVGTFTANGASTVTIANTAVTPSSQIDITLKTVGGSVGAVPAITTITPGTGFTIVATAGDTSVYNYSITG